jgi:hypothetical protein
MDVLPVFSAANGCLILLDVLQTTTYSSRIYAKQATKFMVSLLLASREENTLYMDQFALYVSSNIECVYG